MAFKQLHKWAVVSGQRAPFNSDNPSLNPTEVYNFSVKLLLKRMKIKQKEAGVGPFKKNNYTNWSWLCGSVGRVVASDTRGPRFY